VKKITINYNIKGTIEFPIERVEKTNLSRKEISQIREELISELRKSLDITFVSTPKYEGANRADYKFTKMVLNIGEE